MGTWKLRGAREGPDSPLRPPACVNRCKLDPRHREIHVTALTQPLWSEPVQAIASRQLLAGNC